MNKVCAWGGEEMNLLKGQVFLTTGPPFLLNGGMKNLFHELIRDLLYNLITFS